MGDRLGIYSISAGPIQAVLSQTQFVGRPRRGPTPGAKHRAQAFGETLFALRSAVSERSVVLGSARRISNQRRSVSAIKAGWILGGCQRRHITCCCWSAMIFSLASPCRKAGMAWAPCEGLTLRNAALVGMGSRFDWTCPRTTHCGAERDPQDQIRGPIRPYSP